MRMKNKTKHIAELLEKVDSMPGITIEERAVLYVMSSHANAEGKVVISVEQLAHEAPDWFPRAILAQDALKNRKDANDES